MECEYIVGTSLKSKPLGKVNQLSQTTSPQKLDEKIKTGPIVLNRVMKPIWIIRCLLIENEII